MTCTTETIHAILRRSSMEVTLTITSDFTDPTVSLTLYEADRTTEVTALDDLSWPIDMGDDTDGVWTAIIPGDELDVDVGDEIWIEIEFDDGADNYRMFTGRGIVEDG